MAVIGKIREKSWLLVIVVGVAMLAFVIGDMNPFNNAQIDDVYGIGTINGEKVDEEQYNTFVNNARNNILQTKFQQNPTEQPRLTKQDQENAASQAWRTSAILMLMEKEYKKIGLIVDDIELEHVLYGENGFFPSSLSNQFLDSITGEFQPDELRRALDQLQDSGEEQSMRQYNDILDFVRKERLETKYGALFASGIHTTTLEGKAEYNAQKTVKNVSYVYRRLNDVPADAVSEPTEEEMKKYYDAHKDEKKFEQKAGKEIAYFEIPLLPSEDDTLNALHDLERLIPQFKKSTNDSAFVMRYSDVKQFASGVNGIVKPEGSSTPGATYPKAIEQQVNNAKKGDVIGPYSSMSGVTLSKIIGFEAEKTATVRHILLNAQSDDEVTKAQKKADSIVRVIRSKGNFEEMVTLFSEDPGSKNTGGKYENFTEGTMVPEFNDFSFYEPIGTLGTVKTSYGIHIVEVLGREEVSYPVFANIVKNIKVTKGSSDAINGIASSYIYDLDDLFKGKSIDERLEIIDSFAVNRGYHVQTANVYDDNPRLPGFSEIAEGKVFRLLYDENAKVGDLTSSPVRDNNRFFVGMLTKKMESGTPSFENIKDKIKEEVRKEKKAQYLLDQMLGKSDLESLASELGTKVESEGLTFSASNVSVGNEPKIVGTAFSGLLDGETSVPVVGNNGVFVLRIDDTTLADETTDYSSEIEQIKTQNRNSLTSQFQNSLMNMADIKDNRKLRSYGIR